MQAVVVLELELDPSMESRLRSAASRGKLPEVQDLVAQGADVNHRDPADHDGWTALHGGLRFPAIVEVLLQNGASATLPGLVHGALPLHTAAISRFDGLELLLAVPDIDVNAKGSGGSTALHCALLGIFSSAGPMTRKRAWACVNRLIEAGADVDAVLEDRGVQSGMSPLMIALARCLRAPVKILLRAGAGTATEHPRIQRHDGNAAAFEVVDRVKAVGDWKAYAGKHQRVLAGLVSKCAPRAASPLASKCVSPLPDDAARLVVRFWCPEGGY